MTWSSPPNDDPAQLSTTTADDDSSSKLQAVGAYTDVGEVPPPTSDRYPLYWQGRIAAAASGGGGLDIFRTALESIKQNVPADRALLAHAQCEIWGAGERHLGDSHGVDVLTAIYFAVFSERPPGTQ